MACVKYKNRCIRCLLCLIKEAGAKSESPVPNIPQCDSLLPAGSTRKQPVLLLAETLQLHLAPSI